MILIRHLLVHLPHLYWRRIGILFDLCFCWPTFHSPMNCMSWQRMMTIFYLVSSYDLASQPSLPLLNLMAVYWIWQTGFTETLSSRVFHCSCFQYYESWRGINFSGHRFRLTFYRSFLVSPFDVSWWFRRIASPLHAYDCFVSHYLVGSHSLTSLRYCLSKNSLISFVLS